MEALKKVWFAGLLLWVAQIEIWGATRFDLPVGTLGRQEDKAGNPKLLTTSTSGKKYERVILGKEIPSKQCVLYFPVDGTQPNSHNAGKWSGARHVGQGNDDVVTDWWVRAFGGREAVALSRREAVSGEGYSVLMGFGRDNKMTHIINVNDSKEMPDFKQLFWKTFREIASDPVGRVLLYRLLIEIRRVDENLDGCCEQGIVMLEDRNKLRCIEIRYSDTGFAFNKGGYINFDPSDTAVNTMIFYSKSGKIATKLDPNSDLLSTGLFHEMLHWYHALRHLERYNQSTLMDPAVYRYLLRSYYGDLSELYTWGSINDEELRTILGAPNYDDLDQFALIKEGAFFGKLPPNGISINGKFLPIEARFFNGDDLSENVFRLSIHINKGIDCCSRFGHAGEINKCSQDDRFNLTVLLPKKCYSDITGVSMDRISWDIGRGATR